MPNPTILAFRSFALTFRGENSRVVHFPDFEAHSDDFFVVSGPNGSGKTTFLSLLVLGRTEGGYCIPSLGSAIHFYGPEDSGIKPADNVLDSRLANSEKNFRRYVEYVAQSDELSSARTAYERLLMDVKCTPHAADKLSAAKQRAKEILPTILSNASSGVWDWKMRFHPLSGCSGGQRKMLQLYAAFIKIELLHTPILILDEPLNDLDYKNKALVNNEIQRLRESQSLCIFMVTHCPVIFGINREIAFGTDGVRVKELKTNDLTIHDCLIADEPDKAKKWEEIIRTQKYPK
jgi:ABC-type multidrug transport system ATPase subunit